DALQQCAQGTGGEERIHSGIKSGIGRTELLLKCMLVEITLPGNARKALGKEVGILLFENAAQGGIFQLKRIAWRAPRLAGKGEGATRSEHKLLRLVADLQNII